MGFYTDCINPFGKPNHGYWSNLQPYSFAKLCPECWYIAGHKQLTTVPGPLKKDRSIISKPEKDSL